MKATWKIHVVFCEHLELNTRNVYRSEKCSGPKL